MPVLSTCGIRPSDEAFENTQSHLLLLRDNDGKFVVNFARVAKTSSIEILTIPDHAPQANAICERFLGSVRRECLNHLLILHEKQHEPGTQRVWTLLQPSQAASRDQAADSRAQSWIGASRSRRWQSPRLPGPGWFTS